MNASTTAGPRSGTAIGTGSDEVRWLSIEQQRSWRAYLDGTTRLLEALAHALEADAGLSLAEYEVLVRLSETPGRTMRMSALADSLAHSRSRLTHTVARMEKNGLVARRSCSGDGRGVNCLLTDTGFARLETAAPGHVSAVRAYLVDMLDDEQLRALGVAMSAVGGALVPARGTDRVEEPCEAPLGVCET